MNLNEVNFFAVFGGAVLFFAIAFDNSGLDFPLILLIGSGITMFGLGIFDIFTGRITGGGR